MVGESSLQEIATLAIMGEMSDSGDREIRSKIWGLPDYPGELTALKWEEVVKFI